MDAQTREELFQGPNCQNIAGGMACEREYTMTGTRCVGKKKLIPSEVAKALEILFTRTVKKFLLSLCAPTGAQRREELFPGPIYRVSTSNP